MEQLNYQKYRLIDYISSLLGRVILKIFSNHGRILLLNYSWMFFNGTIIPFIIELSFIFGKDVIIDG